MIINVEFDNQRNSFALREPIRGKVSWSQSASPLESIEIRLVWYTQGKGDRDLCVVTQSTQNTSDTQGQANFDFPAPEQPYSFSGKLISLVWAIEVVFLPGRESESTPIVIGPQGREVLLYQAEGSA